MVSIAAMIAEPIHRTHPLLGRFRWVFPAAILIVLLLVAVLAPWISPQDPWNLRQVELINGNIPPPWTEKAKAAHTEGPADRRFILGTDEQGRDILSAVLYGLRISIFVGVTATLLSLVAGVFMGLLAGYYGGRFDAAIMRAADIQLSFPSVLIALFLMAIWGQGLTKIIVAVAVVHWVIYARVARGMVLTEREKDYISAIRAMGAGTPRILFHHLLPNITGPIFVVSAVEFASVVILEATLSYLGLGVPITRPSLGLLIKFGYDNFFSGTWWVWFFPGVTLVLLIFSVNWLADILRGQHTIGN